MTSKGANSPTPILQEKRTPQSEKTPTRFVSLQDVRSAGPIGSANLQKSKHLNLATLDLNAIHNVDSIASKSSQDAPSVPKVFRILKRNSVSKGRVPLLDRGTSNRGRSLDSSNIFFNRSRNTNRRSSWYGGNIRSTSLEYPDMLKPDPKPNRRCSITSIKTLDSDGFPVRCGVEQVVQVDVHRSASGKPVYKQAIKKIPQIKSVLPGNVTVSIDATPEIHNRPPIDFESHPIYEYNGKCCTGWLQTIDKITSFCPGCSEQIGPILITVSLCAGFVIFVTVILFFTRLVAVLGYRWT